MFLEEIKQNSLVRRATKTNKILKDMQGAVKIQLQNEGYMNAGAHLTGKSKQPQTSGFGWFGSSKLWILL